MHDQPASETGRRWNVFALLSCAIVAALLVSILHEGRIRLVWDMKSSDAMAVLLGGAALILTGVGIFVAILTFWGWHSIRKDAVAAAKREAKACVDAYVASDRVVRSIDQSVLSFLERNVQQGTLLAYLAEQQRKNADMTEFDVEVDDAWANQEDRDV